MSSSIGNQIHQAFIALEDVYFGTRESRLPPAGNLGFRAERKETSHRVGNDPYGNDRADDWNVPEGTEIRAVFDTTKIEVTDESELPIHWNVKAHIIREATDHLRALEKNLGAEGIQDVKTENQYRSRRTAHLSYTAQPDAQHPDDLNHPKLIITVRANQNTLSRLKAALPLAIESKSEAIFSKARKEVTELTKSLGDRGVLIEAKAARLAGIWLLAL